MNRRRGFTLVELLVVIAIIAVLMAMLLPVFMGIRRRALVLACPIAYVGSDGRLHLTDGSGKWDLDIAGPYVSERHFWDGSPPAWSPSGRRIGFTLIERDGSAEHYYCVIMDPLSGRFRKHAVQPPPGYGFWGWFDNDRFLEHVQGPADSWDTILVRDAETGDVQRTVLLYEFRGCGNQSISLAPQCGGYVIAGQRENCVSLVALRRRDLSLGKTLWREAFPASGDSGLNAGARADYMGEYVAWTRYPMGGRPVRIALKRLKDALDSPPQLLGEPFAWVKFCDWTEDGNLLASMYENGAYGLAVLDKRGKLLRRLPVAIAANGGASWRKYGHQ